MQKITSALDGLTPFVRLVALVFGVLAAWHGVCELAPILKGVWAPRGSAQSMALVGAGLAIIAAGGKVSK